MMYRVRLDIKADESIAFEDVCFVASNSLSGFQPHPDHVTLSMRHKSGVYGFGGGDFWPQALARAYEYQEP